MTRSFQLELMYHSASAISQKVKFTPMTALGNQTMAEEHKFLFL